MKLDREKIVYKKVEDLKLNPKNPRKNDEAVNIVAKSIEKYGFKNPLIIDENNVVWCGNTRLKASRTLGLDEAPCIVASDLTEEQIRELALIDNKSSEIAEWDFELLEDEFAELDLSDFELDWGLTEFVEEKEVEEDGFDCTPPEEPKAKFGDVYQLGNHRLMCGDSTKEEDVAKLMDGNKADMVFTDPPYNIDYKGVSDDRKIKNDKMADLEFVEFLEKSIMKCDTAYVCCSWQYCHLFKLALENLGMTPKAIIVWDKVNPAQHLDKYFKQHEIIWYYGKFGGQKTIRGDVWQLKRQRNTVHPTMKPIELISMALKDNPEKKVIYDGFGGSGSTLIACEQLDRTCYTMELDTKYVQVIIERYINLTGNEVYRLNPDGSKTNWNDIKGEN